MYIAFKWKTHSLTLFLVIFFIFENMVDACGVPYTSLLKYVQSCSGSNLMLLLI